MREENVIDGPRYDYQIDYDCEMLSKFSLDEPMYFTDRKKYDGFFLEMAERTGVYLLSGEKVRDIQIENDIIVTESGKIIEAEFVLGVDGVNSTVRKSSSEKIERELWEKYMGVAV